MPTLKHHITDPVTAEREISGLLNDLGHNAWVAGLGEPPTFEVVEIKNFDGVYRCIECGVVQEREQMHKFFQRGEGICKRCFSYDEEGDI